MRKSACWIAVPVLLLVAVPGLVLGQNLAGSWQMSSSVVLPDQSMPCDFSGDVTLLQDGFSLSGQVTLALTSGPQTCPMVMSANLVGELGTETVSGQLEGGQLGTATFVGSQLGGGLSGSMQVESGPFVGVAGSWAASRQPVVAIPVLSPWGLVIMAGFLLAAAWVIFCGRSRRLGA